MGGWSQFSLVGSPPGPMAGEEEGIRQVTWWPTRVLWCWPRPAEPTAAVPMAPVRCGTSQNAPSAPGTEGGPLLPVSGQPQSHRLLPCVSSFSDP